MQKTYSSDSIRNVDQVIMNRQLSIGNGQYECSSVHRSGGPNTFDSLVINQRVLFTSILYTRHIRRIIFMFMFLMSNKSKDEKCSFSKDLVNEFVLLRHVFVHLNRHLVALTRTQPKEMLTNFVFPPLKNVF